MTGLPARGRLLSALNTISVNSAHAVAGTSQPTNHVADGSPGSAEKIRRLSLAAGRRGRQERNRASVKFVSFINNSFQLGFDFLQTVAVAARHRVR